MKTIEPCHGTLFIDLDGTILHSGTNDPLDGAIEFVNKKYESGYQIIVTTFRGYNWARNSIYYAESTCKVLLDLGMKYHNILWDIPSPRIVIDDNKPYAIHHEKDSSWISFNIQEALST